MTPPLLRGLVGAGAAEATRRLGEPATDRRTADARWLRWQGEGWSLRARLGAGGRVASWTLALADGAESLREATETVGLWPACAPDAPARSAEAPLLRRRLADASGGPDLSLTASVRGGRIVALTVFDESPEW